MSGDSSANELIQTLDGFVVEAAGLRAFELPSVNAAPTQVLEALLGARGRLDRVEELLTRAIRARARAHRAREDAKNCHDRAWDRAVTTARTAPVRRGGDEFSSARERHAEANLNVVNEQHALREAHRTTELCDEAVEVLRLMHRGLDGARQDLLAMLRTVAFESHLER